MFDRERRQLVLEAGDCSFLKVVWYAIFAVVSYEPEGTYLAIKL